MAASAIQPEEPSRLQLSLIDGHEEAVPAPAQISPAEPAGDELRAAAGLPPLVMPEWEHETLIDAMRDRGGRKKPAAKPKAKAKAKPEEAPPAPVLNDNHRELLESAAIDAERISRWRSINTAAELPAPLAQWGDKVLPALCLEWETTTGRRRHQLRPDTPVRKKDGSYIRYVFEEGEGSPIGVDPSFKDYWQSPTVPMLLVEGTKQFQAVASTISPLHPIAVPFGVAGCWGWSQDFKPSADLLALPAEGRDVLVGFDADMASNWLVWEAGRRLANYLTHELLARSVRFLLIPGTGEGKDGLDDFLARQGDLEKRRQRLRHLIDTAVEFKAIKQPRKPTKRSGFFYFNNFQSADCWEFLSSQNHLAMAGDVSVAVYRQGVYWNGTSLWWSRLVAGTLGNDYKPEHEHNITKVALAWLKTEQRVIPFQQPQPVINFTNCLLDVKPLRQREHTPEHLTLVQLPHPWDPHAECPTFLKWIEEVAPGQLESLLDVCSQMLDLSEWPRLIVFLTGPTRSGKSTWIRILNALVGDHLRSNVSLHDLSRSDDKFATSSLFAKVLNTFADLSANDLQDLSVVKVLTGGDEFEAQRKNGHRFTMRNQAMLVFSANSIPATSENSGAFLARVAHYEFPFSFVGREDKSIEDKILNEELPGILRLMVEALHKRKQRGNFLPLDQTRQQAFAEKTDRVRMFLKECTQPGDRSNRCIKRPDLFQLFNDWLTEEHGGSKRYGLGKQKFNERVRLAGVQEFKPQGGAWSWDLIEVDPETADPAPPKTADPGSGVDKSGFDFDNGHPSALSEPKLPTKTADPKTAVVVGDLPAAEPGPSAVSAVLPHLPPYTTQPSEITKPSRWVETAETADRPAPVEAADPTPFVGTPPAGITYIAAADQLPEISAIPRVIGFDLETFNRRTDL